MRKAVSTFTPLSSRQLELGSTLALRNTCLTLGLSVYPDSRLGWDLGTLHSSSFFLFRFCMPWFSWESAGLMDGCDHGARYKSTTDCSCPECPQCSLMLAWANKRVPVKWSALFLFSVVGHFTKCLNKQVISRVICLLEEVIALSWRLYIAYTYWHTVEVWPVINEKALGTIN